MKEILLTTINAKWIHPSLALRLLKANLGSLKDRCEILEFALRQPLREKTEPIIAARPRILGISVSIWNHTAVIELLKELEKTWTASQVQKPVIVLGGPEVSHLPPKAEIFNFADYVVTGEGETAFKALCENILLCGNNILRNGDFSGDTQKFVVGKPVNLCDIKTAYHLYTDEDLAKKLIYAESSRGCPFNCDFCLSSISDNKVREFPLEQFLKEMDILINRGAKTLKFLDRTFNSNIKRAIQICEFFLDKIDERRSAGCVPFVVHFEMVPSLLTPKLCEILTRFPPETLRLEIGFQTFNPEVAARIRLPSNQAKGLENLRILRETTNAIIHADLIAGLPGEDLESFGRGFDLLWQTLWEETSSAKMPFLQKGRIEIQVGILKQLPGTPISRHNENWGMRYNHLPPYEIEETSVLSADDLQRIKNFARFWEMITNRGLMEISGERQVFIKFMALSDKLFAYFGQNWGIDKNKLMEFLKNNIRL